MATIIAMFLGLLSNLLTEPRLFAQSSLAYSDFCKLCDNRTQVMAFYSKKGDTETASGFRIWIVFPTEILVQDPENQLDWASIPGKSQLIFDWSNQGIYTIEEASASSECIVVDDQFGVGMSERIIDRLFRDLYSRSPVIPDAVTNRELHLALKEELMKPHCRNVPSNFRNEGERLFWGFIENCIRIGDKKKDQESWSVSWVRCREPKHAVRPDGERLLFTFRSQQIFWAFGTFTEPVVRLNYLEEGKHIFDHETFEFLVQSLGRFSQGQKMNPQTITNEAKLVVGKEGVMNAQTEMRAEFRFSNRVWDSRKIHNVSIEPKIPDWLKKCEGYEDLRQMARKSAILLAGLAVCSSKSWKDEFGLPIDPELLLFPN
ncbi:MAG: hypothetical protein JNK90_17180 [Planctomycetaceae bacterium]|nr:hypothetical protein [Planctomycetaceae bacterium]